MAGSYYSQTKVYERLAGALAEDLQRDADRMTVALFGKDGAPGTKSVSDEEMIAMTKKGWQSESFRQRLLAGIGPDKFLYVAEKAGFYTPELPGSVRGHKEPSADPGDNAEAPPVPGDSQSDQPEAY